MGVIDVYVGRAHFRSWEVESLEDPPQVPALYEEVMIHFYLDHDAKPINGFVSRIINDRRFAVRSGKRQKPAL